MVHAVQLTSSGLPFILLASPFREATGRLFDAVRQPDLAEALDRPVSAIRQARLTQSAIGYRSLPKEWEAAVIELAERRSHSIRRSSLICDQGGRNRDCDQLPCVRPGRSTPLAEVYAMDPAAKINQG